MVDHSLRHFLNNFWKPATLEEEKILKSFEFRNNKVFSFYLFATHFLFYFLLLLPPLSIVPWHFLPHFFFISLLRLILILGMNQNSKQFTLYTIVSESLIYAMLYYVFIVALRQSPTQENFYLVNSFSLIGILLILIYSIRLERFSCMAISIYLAFLHLLYLSFLPNSINDSLLSDFFPPCLFLLSGLFGTVFIFHKRRNFIDLSRMSEERKLIDQDLELAKKVQDALFPKQITSQNIRFHYYRINPQIIGGDFFDFVQLREGNLGVFFTDVAGHGISSALVAAILKVIVSTIPYHFKLQPASLLTYLDSRLAEDLDSYHASAVYLFFDFPNQTLKLANAGHPYILRAKEGESFEEIPSTGSILGFQIRKPIADEISLQFSKGDRFFLYTDGLTECLTNKGEELGVPGVLPILNKNRSIASLPEFCNKVIADLAADHGIKDFSDDTMFLILEL